jgi:hypothetical protein
MLRLIDSSVLCGLQALSKYPMLVFPPFPGKTLTSRFDKQFIEERRQSLEAYFKKVLAIPSIREDGSLMKLLDKSLEHGGMKYFNHIGIKQVSMLRYSKTTHTHSLSFQSINLY